MAFKSSFLSLNVILLVALTSCSVSYKFNSATAPADAKTISIANFPNESSGGPANLSQLFTEKVKEYFLRNTKLSVVKSNGDLHLEGAIVGYTISAQAPVRDANGIEQAATSRITIRVRAKYMNTLNEKDNFEQEFSWFEDFPNSQSLSAVESEKIDVISDNITLQIFTKSFDNW